MGGIIIDTDCGVDDAIAIILARSLDADIVAVTSTFGNADTKQAAENAHRALRASQWRKGGPDGNQGPQKPLPPVFVGAEGPLVRVSTTYRWPGHGPLGLGGAERKILDSLEASVCGDGEKRFDAAADDGGEHAAMAMVRLARSGRAETVILLGPCTNLALAIRLEPRLPSMLKRVVIMGGSSYGKGNTTKCAEFNFYADPEAASVVVNEMDGKVDVITWDACLSAPLPWDLLDRARASPPEFATAHWVSAVCTAYENLCRHRTSETDEPFCPCDAYAIAVALVDDVALDSVTARVEIETGLGPARGAMLIDWYGRNEGGGTARVVNKVQPEKFLSLLEKAILC